MATVGGATFGSLSERRDVGTYTKTYLVDEAQYELYAVTEDDAVSYDLFDHAGRKVTIEPLPEIPDNEAVTGLVRRWRAVVDG